MKIEKQETYFSESLQRFSPSEIEIILSDLSSLESKTIDCFNHQEKSIDTTMQYHGNMKTDLRIIFERPDFNFEFACEVDQFVRPITEILVVAVQRRPF